MSQKCNIFEEHNKFHTKVTVLNGLLWYYPVHRLGSTSLCDVEKPCIWCTESKDTVAQNFLNDLQNFQRDPRTWTWTRGLVQ